MVKLHSAVRVAAGELGCHLFKAGCRGGGPLAKTAFVHGLAPAEGWGLGPADL